MPLCAISSLFGIPGQVVKESVLADCFCSGFLMRKRLSTSASNLSKGGSTHKPPCLNCKNTCVPTDSYKLQCTTGPCQAFECFLADEINTQAIPHARPCSAASEERLSTKNGLHPSPSSTEFPKTCCLTCCPRRFGAAGLTASSLWHWQFQVLFVLRNLCHLSKAMLSR